MRMFIAFDLPKSVKEHISFLQRNIESSAIRLVKTKNLHLTLNFLGDCSDPQLIIDKLKQIKFSPLDLQLDKIGCFPSFDNPKVVWIGLKNCKELDDLQSKIDSKFVPKQSFISHITIARTRIKNDFESKDVISKISSLRVKELKFKLNNFKLFTSTITDFGLIYRVIEKFGSVK